MGSEHHISSALFGFLALLLLVAKLGGVAVSRVRLPAVLGELTAGLVLTAVLPSALRLQLQHDSVLAALAEVGVILLMFEVGLETNPAELRKVGVVATLVAILGVAVPMGLGTLVSWLFHRQGPWSGHLFVGATLSATSVGITARVLRDQGKTQSIEARIILAAAVLDDILALVLLALVAGMVRSAAGTATLRPQDVALLLARSAGFLVLAFVVGRWVVPRVMAWLARLRSKGSLLVYSLALCFLSAWAADRFGLAPAVGAFFAGLMLREDDLAVFVREGDSPLSDQLSSVANVFVPLFFILAGVHVDLSLLASGGAALMALAITASAIVGKLATGLAVRGREVRRWVVGMGMVPRGEVGLIFAAVGAGLQVRGEAVIAPKMFTALIVMVVVTSLVAPVGLGIMIQTAKPQLPWRRKKQQ